MARVRCFLLRPLGIPLGLQSMPLPFGCPQDALYDTVQLPLLITPRAMLAPLEPPRPHPLLPPPLQVRWNSKKVC